MVNCLNDPWNLWSQKLKHYAYPGLNTIFCCKEFILNNHIFSEKENRYILACLQKKGMALKQDHSLIFFPFLRDSDIWKPNTRWTGSRLHCLFLVGKVLVGKGRKGSFLVWICLRSLCGRASWEGASNWAFLPWARSEVITEMDKKKPAN